MKFFEGLDKVSVRNLVEYIEHAGAWAKNTESDSRITKIENLLKKDKKLRNYVTEKTIKKNYHKLWAGTRWKINNEEYSPKTGDVIRREDKPYQVWSQRKSAAVKSSGYNEAVDKPQTGGTIVKIQNPIPGNIILLDVKGLFNLLREMRKEPNDLRDQLMESLDDLYDNDYMYRIFNSLRRLKARKEKYEVITPSNIDMAKVEADYSHRDGLLEAKGSWRTNRRTEIL